MRRELTWTGSAMNSLHMDPGRFLYDDGHTTICPTGVRKTQGVRRVGGRAATSQDAGSHTRQGGRGGHGIHVGQAPSKRACMLKSRASDTITGRVGNIVGRSDESRRRQGLGRKSTNRCSTYDEANRSMTPLANPERPTFHLFTSAVAFSAGAMFSTEGGRVLPDSTVNRVAMIYGVGGWHIVGSDGEHHLLKGTQHVHRV